MATTNSTPQPSRRVGWARDHLDGWYTLPADPVAAKAQAELILAEWERPLPAAPPGEVRAA